MLVFYILNASIDIPFSDYIRIINNYIYNVFDLKYLFTTEAVSRVPITFLFRIINVVFFSYSVIFDKILGVFFLSLFNFITVLNYSKNINNKILKIIGSICISIISFSLLSWEMILNGTGYAHFITIFLISLIYFLFDKYINDNNKNINIILFIIFFTSVCCAGSYSVAFLITISIFPIFLYIVNKKNKTAGDKKNIIKIIIVSLICIFLYYISVSIGEPITHVGMKNISLIEVLNNDLLFPLKFLFNSLAGSLIGRETLDYFKYLNILTDKKIYIIGIIYFVIIVFFAVLYIKNKIYNKYVYVGLFAVNGIINFLLVFLARYKFVNTDYGMSSRYGIQYMFLSIAIIYLSFLFIDKYCKKIFYNIFLVLIVFFIIICHIITIKNEYDKMYLRKEYYEKVKNSVVNMDKIDDDELMNIFEYKRSSEHIRNAYKILKENHLNIYSLKEEVDTIH